MAKAKITWKGEGEGSPPSTRMRHVVFPLDEAVEVDDPAIIAKAKGNRYFEVEAEEEDAPSADPTDPDPVEHNEPDKPKRKVTHGRHR